MQDFPFRYYGTDPGDWYDYGWVLVQFVTRPDADARKKIKDVAYTIPASKARRWKGRVLSIFLEDIIGQPSFGTIRRTLLEMHEIAPIEQAVNHLARQHTGDDWEGWSLAQGKPDEDLFDPNDLSVWSFED